MPKEKQLVPQLRFPEFDGFWEKKAFGDIAKRRKERYNPKEKTTNYRCIELESLTQETGMLLYTFDSNEQKSSKNVFFKNDILFGKLRPYLKKFYKSDFNGVCSSEIWVLTGTNAENEYLYYLIQTDKFNYEVNQTSGSKMPRADWGYISEISFSIPPLPEQQKIADFLTSIDSHLQTLEKKKAALELYKKGVTQQIFKQELRFKDEDGSEFPEWEKMELGYIFKPFKGKGIPKSAVTQDGANKCILYGELYTTYNEIIHKVVSKTNSNDGLISKKGDLLIPSSTTTTGIDLANVTALNFDNVLLGGDIIVLRGKSEINNVFYAYYLSTHKKYNIAARAQGITIVHLYFNSIKDLIIDLPSLPEQTKIANFLSAIDQQIQGINQQIEHTKIYKKGLLQQMFV